MTTTVLQFCHQYSKQFLMSLLHSLAILDLARLLDFIFRSAEYCVYSLFNVNNNIYMYKK